MKKYIGTKQVKATPAIRKGGKVYLPEDIIPKTMESVEEGYKVVYEDGYESWSPKEVFDKAYRIAETFKDRLIIEHDKLEEKLDKLNIFNNSEKANEIDPVQRTLLRIQAGAMYTYLECIKERLVRLEGGE